MKRCMNAADRLYLAAEFMLRTIELSCRRTKAKSNAGEGSCAASELTSGAHFQLRGDVNTAFDATLLALSDAIPCASPPSVRCTTRSP